MFILLLFFSDLKYTTLTLCMLEIDRHLADFNKYHFKNRVATSNSSLQTVRTCYKRKCQTFFSGF